MTINSNQEALQRRTVDRNTIITNAVNKVASNRVSPAQAEKCENRRKIELHEEEKRLMKMFALDLD